MVVPCDCSSSAGAATGGTSEAASRRDSVPAAPEGMSIGSVPVTGTSGFTLELVPVSTGCPDTEPADVRGDARSTCSQASTWH